MATNFKRVDALVDAAMKTGLLALGNDVKKRAIVLAPKDSGTLRQSAKIESKPNSVIVSFNTPYARRRHYENYLHPSTKLYLNNALRSVKNVTKYFKKAF